MHAGAAGQAAESWPASELPADTGVAWLGARIEPVHDKIRALKDELGGNPGDRH
ncbi:MAG: hypothetical protein SGJ21_04640 [Alphaproteobacteria bacterium]|nr:hypothetical protein [Alphaproteobacteria bacterium]